jgi:hypothetical protein
MILISVSIAIVSSVAFLTVIGVIDWNDKCGNTQNQYWIPQYEKLDSERFDKLGPDTFFNQSGVYRFTHHECNGNWMTDYTSIFVTLVIVVFLFTLSVMIQMFE